MGRGRGRRGWWRPPILDINNISAYYCYINRVAAGEDDLIEILDHGDYGRLDPAEAALARYVHKVTLTPGEVTEADIEALRAVGLTYLEFSTPTTTPRTSTTPTGWPTALRLLSEAAEAERSKSRVPGYDA